MTKHRLLTLRIALLMVGAGFAAFGILRGELTEIMRKAVIVCLECIGIG
ncbi:MAG: hypothetical protein FWG70_06600 [Oscillospiraceae bacterium]|nr:hypothetical protein [Oscillospiraceae bacterium]